MQLVAPQLAPNVNLKDINGKLIKLNNGKPTYLAFFRDATCPFCNTHIFRLTEMYPQYAHLGLDIVAVFASQPQKVKRFILSRPRPFAVAAEPEEQAYKAYGIEKSFSGKLKAVFAHFPTLLYGLTKLGFVGSVRGLAGVNTNNMMPADFLINEEGHIMEAYYGHDAADHIPFDRIELFIARQAFKHKRKKPRASF